MSVDFQDWSWATHSLSSRTYAHSGRRSIYFEPDYWTAVYFHHVSGIVCRRIASINLWVRGGKRGGEKIDLVIGTDDNELARANLDQHLSSGQITTTWQQARVSLFCARPFKWIFHFESICRTPPE